MYYVAWFQATQAMTTIAMILFVCAFFFVFVFVQCESLRRRFMLPLVIILGFSTGTIYVITYVTHVYSYYRLNCCITYVSHVGSYYRLNCCITYVTHVGSYYRLNCYIIYDTHVGSYYKLNCYITYVTHVGSYFKGLTVT